MKDSEARSVALRVLDDLGEPYAVAEGPHQDPLSLSLNAGPNPATRTIRISYSLPVPSPVRLALYDAGGKRVRQLLDARQPAGRYELRLSTRDLPAGTYFCRLKTEEPALTSKLVLQR
jgi:hypothetical protein